MRKPLSSRGQFDEIPLSPRKQEIVEKPTHIIPAPYLASLQQSIFITGLIMMTAMSAITLLLVLFAPPIALFLFATVIMGTGTTITIGGSIWYVWTQSFQQKHLKPEDTTPLINYTINT